jgi:hypothetical protein
LRTGAEQYPLRVGKSRSAIKRQPHTIRRCSDGFSASGDVLRTTFPVVLTDSKSFNFKIVGSILAELYLNEPDFGGLMAIDSQVTSASKEVHQYRSANMIHVEIPIGSPQNAKVEGTVSTRNSRESRLRREVNKRKRLLADKTEGWIFSEVPYRKSNARANFPNF